MDLMTTDVSRALSSELYEARGRMPPRVVPIDALPPLETRETPTIQAGDLVRWRIRRSSNPAYYSPLGHDARGLVLETRWSLCDYPYGSTVEHHYYPEAVIMWNDGAVTCSHHVTVRRVQSSGR